MDELPGIGVIILITISDEVLSLPDWRQELAAGGND